MEMEHKSALSDGSTCYDKEGIFTVVELYECDIGTDIEIGEKYTFKPSTIQSNACFIPENREKGNAFLGWEQLAQEGAGAVLTKESEWQPPKTKAEDGIRMVNGEVFGWSGRQMYFDQSESRSPFRIKFHPEDKSVGMCVSWDDVFGFTQHIHEPKWDDNLSEKNSVWCWVSDSPKSLRDRVMKVIGKHECGGYAVRYSGGKRTQWRYAEPCPQLAGVDSDDE